MRIFLFGLLFLCARACQGQVHKIQGKVTNSKQEPVAFVSIQVKGSAEGAITREDGLYSLELEDGVYELLITMRGYKSRIIAVVLSKKDYPLDILLETDVVDLSAVIIKGKTKDRAEEYIRYVIRKKETTLAASGAYSFTAYIKAMLEDSAGGKQSRRIQRRDSLTNDQKKKPEEGRFSIGETVLHIDKAPPRHIREEKLGETRKGNTSQLGFLSTAEGEFNFYENIITIPSLSSASFLSPLSYSGLQAYRYKTIKTETVNGQKQFTVSVRPRQLSNATVEGELVIADSSWVILYTRFRFPAYHLAAYDFFEVEQHYSFIAETAWLVTWQQLTYRVIRDKCKLAGQTTFYFRNFELNKHFPKGFFGPELSTATTMTYKQDSSFWQSNRAVPLSEKEVRVINFRDSVYRATHTKAYLDSMDKITNRVTWQKILYKGQQLYDHEKRRSWTLPSLIELYQPVQFGGSRLEANAGYSKIFESRRSISIYTDMSYGLRNRDLNGSLRMNGLYNPFSRGTWYFSAEKNFEYIFSGDAWINMIKRSNVYLHEAVGLGHSLELTNGLFLFTHADIAFRKSVSRYKTNDRVDSLFGNELTNNTAIDFPSYKAFYMDARIEYTPQQRYIREPKEKVIIGSSWPTFYLLWKKGVPGVFQSKIDFDYFEAGIKQSVKLGILGTSSYTIRTGAFANKKDLRLVDYKYQRRGDPLLFLNPNEAFQALDSTFPVFSRFYEAHYIHEFNGAILNKVPFFKKIGLREVAGGGFLFAKERNLRYAELFTGVERVFRYPFKLPGKFKLGVYAVGSVANQFRNPIQFKVGITAWDRRKGKWF